MGTRLFRSPLPYLVFAVLLSAIILTDGDYGAHWDAPHYLSPITRMADWASARLFSAEEGPPVPPLSDVDYYFPLADHHPPLMKVVAAGTVFLFRDSMGLLGSARVAIALFSALVGTVLFIFLERFLGRGYSAAAVLLWITIPRVFAHAHFVALDQPVSLFYLSALVLFYLLFEEWSSAGGKGRPRRLRKLAILTAAVLGLGFLTKHQVHFVVPGVLAWTLYETAVGNVEPRRRFFRWAGLTAGIWAGALAIEFAGWPAMWHDTVSRVGAYIEFVTEHAQVPVIYFGRRYPPGTPPWHFPFVMWLVTAPVVTLLLAAAGSVVPVPEKLRRVRRFLVFGAATPFFFLALPGVPRFDGVRHLLPAAPFFAALAAVGLRWAVETAGSRAARWASRVPRRWVQGAVGGLLILGAGLPAITWHPFEQVYYNQLIGGLSGAVRRGMDADYLGVSVHRLFPNLNGMLEAGDVLFVTGMNPKVLYPPLNRPWPGARPDQLLETRARVVSLELRKHLVSAAGRAFLLVNQRRSQPASTWESYTGGRPPLEKVDWDGVRLCAVYALEWEKGIPIEPVYTRGPVALLEAHAVEGSRWEGLWGCRKRTLENWGVSWQWRKENGDLWELGYESQLVPISATRYWLPGDVYRAWYGVESTEGAAELSVAVWPNPQPDEESLRFVRVLGGEALRDDGSESGG